MNNVRSILKNRIPGQLIIQYTDYCNATCPQCNMRKTEPFRRSKLPEEEIYKIINSAARQNIQALSFTGGEPFLYQEDLLSLLIYASQLGIPYLRTGTNGFMFSQSEDSHFEDKIHRFAEELSKTKLRNFWISIDSAEPETHEQMRGLKGVIRGIEKALPIFHEYGIYPAANLGINRNTGGSSKVSLKMTDEDTFLNEFKESFDLFYQFVINLGFTMVNACYPMSSEANEDSAIAAVYGAASDSSIISFSKDEKIQIFKALMETIPKYRSKIRIFTPLVSLYSLVKQYEGDKSYALPCHGGIDFFFVDAKTGDTYPCGYRGNESLGKFYKIDIAQLKSKPFCKSCDWECFRDPSELIGFFIRFVHNPRTFFQKNSEDPYYIKLWKEDIRYYISCDYFDGRKPMKAFS